MAKADENAKATTEDAVEETAVVKQATASDKPQVVGEITPEEIRERNLTQVYICRECGWVHKEGKGVTSCAACGGKTTLGFKDQADAIKAEDEARFTGASADAAAKGEWNNDDE
jgi:rubredoxin